MYLIGESAFENNFNTSNFQFLQICNQFAFFFLPYTTAFLRGLDQTLKLAFKFGLFPSIQGTLLQWYVSERIWLSFPFNISLSSLGLVLLANILGSTTASHWWHGSVNSTSASLKRMKIRNSEKCYCCVTYISLRMKCLSVRHYVTELKLTVSIR